MQKFIEVTNLNHGGGQHDIWGLGIALWAPSRDVIGRDMWKILKELNEDDIVYHIVKIDDGDSVIYGKSKVAGPLEIRHDRPWDPGLSWGGAESYYRIPLKDHVVFENKVRIGQFLEKNKKKLHQKPGTFYDKNCRLANKYVSRLFEGEAKLLEEAVR